MEIRLWKRILPVLMAAVLAAVPMSSVQADPRPEVNVYLFAEDFGGYSCATASDNFNQCTYRATSADPDSPNFTYFPQNVSFFSDQQNTISAHPFENYQFASVTISEVDDSWNTIDSTTVIATSNTGSFLFESSQNVNFTFTWSGSGDLIIPANIPRLEIRFKYLPVVTLTQTENGRVCIEGIGLNPIPCSTSVTSEIEFDNYSNNSAYNPQILVDPGSGYQFESLTITIGNQSATVTSTSDSLSVPKSTDGNWIFTWQDGFLVAPALVPSFQVAATFIPEPPQRAGLSIASGEAAFNATEPFHINSGDENIQNYYDDIVNIWGQITYFGVDPVDSSITNARLSCRFPMDLQWEPEQDDWHWRPAEIPGFTDGRNLDILLPSTQDILYFCPTYHQSAATTEIVLGLFDESVEPAAPNAHANAAARVSVTVNSPPAILDVITEGEYEFGQELAFEISNKDAIKYVSVEILSNKFGTESCVLLSNKRDLDGNFIVGAIDEDNKLHHQIPTLAEINTQCADGFVTGNTSIDPAVAHTLIIRSLDINGNYEQFVEIQVQPHALPAPTPAPREVPIIIPQFSPPIVQPQTQPESAAQPSDDQISTQSNEVSNQSENKKQVPQVPIVESKNKGSGDEAVAEVASWCYKKGIWIHTQSGILKMCDLEKKVSLEIPACAGKDKTPTYPWIFRAQRFLPGVTNSKSGVELHNAVFFYKGLAISGSKEVLDKPCSNGSVFIPMDYSKQVFNFAKQQRPLIWVKAD